LLASQSTQSSWDKLRSWYSRTRIARVIDTDQRGDGGRAPPSEKMVTMRKWHIASGAALLIVAGAAYLARDQMALARIGTGFAAKQTCSCLYLSRRSLSSCMTDFDPAAARWFAWRIDDQSVTVSAVFGIFSSTSVLEDGFGCHVVE
jgi:hypothetical protein